MPKRDRQFQLICWNGGISSKLCQCIWLAKPKRNCGLWRMEDAAYPHVYHHFFPHRWPPLKLNSHHLWSSPWWHLGTSISPQFSLRTPPLEGSPSFTLLPGSTCDIFNDNSLTHCQHTKERHVILARVKIDHLLRLFRVRRGYFQML